MGNQLICKVKLEKKTYPRNVTQIGDWGILKCRVEEIDSKSTVTKVKVGDLISVKGYLPNLVFNGQYKLNATEEFSDKYGVSYQIDFICSNFDFEDDKDIKTFFETILTEAEYELVVNNIDNPLDVIRNRDVETLTSVKGIGNAKANKIIDSFYSNIDYSKIYVELKELGLTQNMTKKLLEKYQSPDNLVAVIKENPYILADDIDGIGFKKADEIALASGVSFESPYRVASFVEFQLKNEAALGHSFIKPSEIMGHIKSELGNVSLESIKEGLESLRTSNKIRWEKDTDRLYLVRLYELEHNILKELKRLSNSKNKFSYDNVDDKIKELEGRQGWEFTDEQKSFIKGALKENVVSLVGGGGTGKTSTVNAVVHILSEYYTVGVALAGKATDRLAETSDCDTSTIHRLIGKRGDMEDTLYNKTNRMNHIDILIVDETSMIGGGLFYDLSQAIESETKVILIGDTGQLEAIGECNVFTDIVNGSFINTFELTKIHRQAQKSAIITESFNVRNGRHIINEGFSGIEIRGELKDLTIDIHSNSLFTAPKVIKYFKEGLKNTNIMDLQIIVPLRTKGDISVYELNQTAQEIYNNKSNKFIEVTKGFKKYRLKENDKIIIRKNNYNIETTAGDEYPIYNGNIGIIKKIDNGLNAFIIQLKNNVEVVVPFSFKSGIELGYAITIHSSQGSQFDNVIIGIDYSCFIMLTRELLYTALTRASKNCILCGEGKAIRYAVETTYVSTKRTFLKNLLTND